MHAAEAVDERRGDERAQSVAGVPACDAERLLGAAVERNGDDGEDRHHGGLECAKEEARHEQPGVGARAGEAAGDGNAPAGDDNWENLAVAELDEEPGGEGLNTELGVVADVSDVGVVVTLELRVSFQAVDSGETDDALVAGLQEVDHAEEGEHPYVGLAQDALVVGLVAEVGGAQPKVVSLLEGHSEAGGIVEVLRRRIADVLDFVDVVLFNHVVLVV